ncbi:Nop domain-containing protein [Eremomyces bilateralis CBS 781.70]|uniref:Nucleolar protein 58 n=1 Tax=Eremomyces bilateralis CBS 781.70 TaxID=1392243 RepID=A0A6G1G1V0_9PEZI|nr:Nop domain-containing protein [Eremomyces bilateralis CBS 781.70]KAF1811901.1 Nop domain-containing protein [Eremomyces bilateralis CBS 781.70]
MPLFVLTETSAGYALLKAKDKKLLKRDDLSEKSSTAEGLCDMLKLKKFRKFENATEALDEAAAVMEGKVTPVLSKLLDELKEETKASLTVADPKLANAINKLPQLSLAPIADSTTEDLYRAIRQHLPSLIPGLLPTDIDTMNLGLSHSLSRHKLKFSPDKVDTMIVQAINLLDDLDKELNVYAMRVKEWYGWHFPEMARIINDNMAYARVVIHVGMRSNASSSDLTDILPEEIEGAVKAAAEISMGTEITDEDLENIKALAEQVISFSEYRIELANYLNSRMVALAPNLTTLVGDLVGARLIAHAGSLLNLAKSPGSTIQIIGAEKALFRALKTKHDTPKYGLIYHASLVGQASGKNKGKIARMLAAKTALGLRADALSDWGTAGAGKGPEPSEEDKALFGVASRIKIEQRLRALEGKPLAARGTAIGPGGQTQNQPKWEVKEARKYNADADGLQGDEPAGHADQRETVPTNGTKAEAMDVDEDEESDEEMEDQAEAGATNGTAKDDRAAKKAEKKARKEAKAEKKRLKEEKKAAKEGKGSKEEKKRKRGANDDEGKKKKKKSRGD